MKNFSLYKILFITVLVSLFFSCDDFLERTPDGDLSEEEVFTQYSYTNELVTDLYSSIKSANRPLVFFDDFSTAPVTDECEGSTAEGGITNQFNSGNWGPSGFPSNSYCGQYWESLYAGIRQANLILEGIEKYNTPDNNLGLGDLSERIGEVYFMRGYLHYLAARMYGEIVYVDHVIYSDEDMNFKRQSFHEIARKIVRDCDSAYARVPYKSLGQDFGRVDKGACLGLKAMIRWMEATPMWNGGSFQNDTRSFASEYATYSSARWDTAKVAAKAVLDFTVDGEKRYSLYTEHSSTDFASDDGNDYNNSKVYARLWDMYYDEDAYKNEAVFFVTVDKDCYWQGDVYPPSAGGGSRQMPVQEQVDEYEYIAPDGYGYPVYSSRAVSDGYDDGNPYESVQRDPRFHRDIVYHGSYFWGSPINTASGSNEIGAANSTSTGYFLRKFFKESWNRDSYFTISGPPIWRLPHFIYIYAEAVNETDGPSEEIYNLINEVRARSFMAPMPTAVLSDKDLMNEYIQRERRVEFFYENDRIWSCRLYLEPESAKQTTAETAWSNAGSTNTERSQNYWPYPKCQRMINGMRPVQDDAGKIVIDGVHYRMERFFVESRVFETPTHYLFPLMSSEIARCPTLVQNPGW